MAEPTPLNLLRMAAVLFTAISTGAGLAHLLTLPHKMALSAGDYFSVQRAYDGWESLDVVMLAALVFTTGLAVTQKQRPGSGWSYAAAGCMFAGLVVFFGCVFPANSLTGNWTVVTGDWAALRSRWEIGHAVNAVSFFLALVCLVCGVIRSMQRDANPAIERALPKSANRRAQQPHPHR